MIHVRCVPMPYRRSADLDAAGISAAVPDGGGRFIAPAAPAGAAGAADVIAELEAAAVSPGPFRLLLG